MRYRPSPIFLLVAAIAFFASLRISYAQSFPSQAIHYVSVGDQGEATVFIGGRQPCASARLTDPDRFYVDFRGAAGRAQWTAPPVPQSDPFVRQIRVGTSADGRTRVVLDLQPDIKVSVAKLSAPPRLLLTFKRNEVALAPSASLMQTPRSRDDAEGPDVLSISRVTQAPTLQSFLGGPPGIVHATATNFLQYKPGDGTSATEKTEAYLSYDAQNLYVVFVCHDKRNEVRAHISRRDDIGDDDGVTLYLDSSGDPQHAYMFSVNPLGVQADAIVTDGNSTPDYTFDTLWYSAGRLTRDGYIVWMAIPFKSLRFPHDPDQTWRIALSRSILSRGEQDMWPYITQRNASFIGQFGKLKGLYEISPSRNIQLIPYIYGVAETLSNGTMAGYRNRQQYRGGIDGKVILRDALSLDFTVNPDFSQVETDDPQITVDKRYEVYFPEKRPFFIEDAGYFSTPINLFFTRNIVDPEFGARLAGKLGRWSIGVLGMDDRAPGEILASSDPLYGNHAVIGATRIQRDIGSQSFVGMMYTHRSFGSSSNQVASIDTRIRINPTWYFAGQIVQTDSHQEGAGHPTADLQGKGYSAEISRTGRYFSFTSSYLDISPDFQSQIGFVPRKDMRQVQHYAGYLWRPAHNPILDHGFSETFTYDWNRLGQLQDWNSYLQYQMDLTHRIGFTVTHYDAYELYLDQNFRYQTTGASFYANWLRWLYLSGSYTQGQGVNYFPASGVSPFLGGIRNASLDAKIRPNSHLSFEGIYYYSGLKTRNPISGIAGLPSVFNQNLSRAILNYQFTRALSLRAILDYDVLLSNSALFDQQTSKQLIPNILCTYLVNPGTAVYLGYAANYQNYAVNPAAPSSLILSNSPTYLTGKQFFIKVSYRQRF